MSKKKKPVSWPNAPQPINGELRWFNGRGRCGFASYVQVDTKHLEVGPGRTLREVREPGEPFYLHENPEFAARFEAFCALADELWLHAEAHARQKHAKDGGQP